MASTSEERATREVDSEEFARILTKQVYMELIVGRLSTVLSSCPLSKLWVQSAKVYAF